MAFTVTFWKNYNKRVNSTAVPDTTGTTDYYQFNCELKSPTSIFSPTLLVREFDGDDTIKYNYCYIDKFARYYFVKSWLWENGLWDVSLEIDILATYKTQIGNTTAYVLRSASNYNTDVLDTKYPTRSSVNSLETTYPTPWYTDMDSSNIANGFYVLGVVNNDTNSIGATSYYAVSGTTLRTFLAALYASPSWMSITDSSISTDLQKMLINPIQYIVSCMFMPCYLDVSGLATTTSVPVGWWNISLASSSIFYKLTGAKLKTTQYQTISIPVHPNASNEKTFLKNSPYSQYQLQYYPYGVFSIDSAKLIGFTDLYCTNNIDLITGVSTLTITRRINNNDYGVIYASSAQLGIPISLAQMSVDMSRVGNGATWAMAAGMALVSDSATSELIENTGNYINTAVGNAIASANDAGGLLSKYGVIDAVSSATFRVSDVTDMGYTASAPSKAEQTTPFSSIISSVGKVAANIGNAVLASSGTCQTIGNNGALCQYTLPVILTLYYYNIVDTDLAHYGAPLCASVQINTLSGFVLCANEGDLAVPTATAAERQAIGAFMTAGFYYV